MCERSSLPGLLKDFTGECRLFPVEEFRMGYGPPANIVFIDDVGSKTLSIVFRLQILSSSVAVCTNASLSVRITIVDGKLVALGAFFYLMSSRYYFK